MTLAWTVSCLSRADAALEFVHSALAALDAAAASTQFLARNISQTVRTRKKADATYAQEVFAVADGPAHGASHYSPFFGGLRTYAYLEFVNEYNVAQFAARNTT